MAAWMTSAASYAAMMRLKTGSDTALLADSPRRPEARGP
jgi:hypothetical protein